MGFVKIQKGKPTVSDALDITQSAVSALPNTIFFMPLSPLQDKINFIGFFSGFKGTLGFQRGI